MKEAIGGSWLFVFVIIFISIFAAFISLAVNYSRCYKTKDEIVKIISNYRGVNKDSIKKINETLINTGYRNTGKCFKDTKCWYAFSIKNNNNTVSYSQGTNYCIAKTELDINEIANDGSGSRYVHTSGTLGHMSSSYYTVMVFFGLDLPVLRSNFQLNIVGETQPIYTTNDFSFIKDKESGNCA